ncbi:hypothetical protein F3Y22_tig00116964pilonHSYRG00164 [Hibiscus syriacus]|uniref:Uncharacterized protein n=1 Tax=Hibiscus syriacus TaxID=106335 RepID=A0A6A2WUS5_HIBSY|nr:hypothetical protein F3Y22_tig00116964pilonHSYRG00164 [Hibiscus syriacus]
MESLALSSSLLTPPIHSLSSFRYDLVNASTSHQAPNLSLSLRKSHLQYQSHEIWWSVHNSSDTQSFLLVTIGARCLLSSPSGLLVYGPRKRRLEVRDTAACFPAWVRFCRANRTVRDRGQPVVSVANEEKKMVRLEFSVSLSKQEIEEDLMVMVGRHSRKRPKKRACYVQKELDLTEVTADSYNIPGLTGYDNR